MTDDSLPSAPGFRIKRAYDPPEPDDGYRVLVDRLWPRGVAKTEARIDEWPREVTPSADLRRWFHQDPESRRAEFTERYRDELAAPAARETLDRLRGLARDRPPVTLVTAVKDPAHSHVPVLVAQLCE